MKPVAIDLCCGLGGWTEGLLAEGWDVIGFDVERHAYGGRRYPAHIVLQDIRSIHGARFRSAALIVASPPCQEFSYMAMPWSRAKQIAQALYARKLCEDGPAFPDGYAGSRTISHLTALFDTCFRIQSEASEASGRRIPLVVENVRGAQPWVGRARWHYGSYYLWGDVPALMPITFKGVKVSTRQVEGLYDDTTSGTGQNPDGRPLGDETKIGGDWFSDATEHALRKHSSKSNARKAASARIAKIPLALARHIAKVYYPRNSDQSSR